VAALSKEWVCGPSFAGTEGLNPAGGIHVCLLGVFSVVRQSCLRRADHSSRGVLLSVVCLNECDRETSIMRRPWYTRVCRAILNK
jgi:hypothetical protein